MRKTCATLAAVSVIVAGAGAIIAPAAAQADPVDDLIALLEAGSSDANPIPLPGIPAANGVVGVEMEVVDSRNAKGVKLGPNLFGMTSGKFKPLIKYNAYTSNGGTNRSDDCQIEIQVTGPQNSVVRKTAHCHSQYYTTEITAAGRYTASVTDRVSGRVGRVVFTVE